MSDLTKYLGNKIIRWIAGNTMPTAPVSVYVALFDGDPKASGTEVTTTIRSAGRVSPTWTVPAPNSTDNVLTSSGDANFGNSEGVADISHVAVFDAATGGNMLSSKALPAAIAATTGIGINFPAGKLRFTIGS